MSRAELGLPAPLDAVPRLRRASRVVAPLVADVHHALAAVPGAELRFVGPGDPEPWLGGAIGMTAPLGPDVHHALAAVPRAKLGPVAGLHAVGGLRRATGVVAAPSFAGVVHEPGSRVPRAEVRPVRPFLPVLGPDRAAWVHARPLAWVAHCSVGRPDGTRDSSFLLPSVSENNNNSGKALQVSQIVVKRGAEREFQRLAIAILSSIAGPGPDLGRCCRRRCCPPWWIHCALRVALVQDFFAAFFSAAVQKASTAEFLLDRAPLPLQRDGPRQRSAPKPNP